MTTSISPDASQRSTAVPGFYPERRIAVCEIFGPTIQGEGALVGKPTVFVRTGGCDYRCTWCDTLYAIEPDRRHNWQRLPLREIFDEVKRLAPSPLLVTLSGGNPAMWNLADLLMMGHHAGYTFAMETQGTLAPDWIRFLDQLTLSPKPPSSGMTTNWAKLEACVEIAPPATCLKVVVFDDEDYAFARKTAETYPHLPMYIQPGNHTPPESGRSFDLDGVLTTTRWLIDLAIRDHWYDVTVLPQLHTLLWGNQRGI